MSQTDEQFGPLPDGGAAEIGNAVLGDHILDVVPLVGDHSAGGQGRLDLGHALLGAAGEAQDALAVLGEVGAQGEAEAAAGAGVLHRADGLGADLTGQVDLHQGVDGNHVVLLGDVEGVDHLGAGLHDALGIVMQVLIQLMGAVGEHAHVELLVEDLVLAGDVAVADQLHQGGGELLGVQAQVVLGEQVAAHGVGNAADAHLDGVAVVDQVGHGLADLVLQLGGLDAADAVLGGVHLVQQSATRQSPR